MCPFFATCSCSDGSWTREPAYLGQPRDSAVGPLPPGLPAPGVGRERALSASGVLGRALFCPAEAVRDRYEAQEGDSEREGAGPGLRAWADLILNLASPSPALDVFPDAGLGATQPPAFAFNGKSYQRASSPRFHAPSKRGQTPAPYRLVSRQDHGCKT